MRKTIPQYTIFTCDCCGREQDDSAFQQDLVANQGVVSEHGPEPLRIFPVKWSRRDRNFKEWQNANSMEVCEECAQRIHDAIQDVKRRASSEALQESLAIYERTKQS